MSQDATDLGSCLPHPKHFYETGDVILEAQSTLFRVHAGEYKNSVTYYTHAHNLKPSTLAKLCRYSEVFKDMFGLPQIGSSDMESKLNVNGRITLQDDPQELAVLLDVVYWDLEFPSITLKQYVQLALLAHKYEMPAIQATCQRRMCNSLPTAIGPRDFFQAQNYHQDPSIAFVVIRAAELLQMPELLPWAMYFFTIQFEPANELGQASLLSEGDPTIRNSREAVRLINRRAIKHWNKSITWFMRGDCSSEWWDDPDECWRRSELLDIEGSSFILDEYEADPLQAMYEALDFCSQDLCSLCADHLTEHSNREMEEVLEGIGYNVLEI